MCRRDGDRANPPGHTILKRGRKLTLPRMAGRTDFDSIGILYVRRIDYIRKHWGREGVVELSKYKTACEKTAWVARGDDCCEYHIRWKKG